MYELTYNPKPKSTLMEITETINKLADNVEKIRQERRQRQILENILTGKKPDEWMPVYTQPKPPKTLLGRIMQTIGSVIDPNMPPRGITPLEVSISPMIEEYKRTQQPQPQIFKTDKSIVLYDPTTSSTQVLYSEREKPTSKVYTIGNQIVEVDPDTKTAKLIYQLPKEPKEENLNVKERILMKLASGQPLTEGEAKIYDEILTSKYQEKTKNQNISEMSLKDLLNLYSYVNKHTNLNFSSIMNPSLRKQFIGLREQILQEIMKRQTGQPSIKQQQIIQQKRENKNLSLDKAIWERITEAKKQGIPDTEISKHLRAKGIDPKRYNLE